MTKRAPRTSEPALSLRRRATESRPLDLDQEQRAAVDHRASSLLLVGGPGTGKTTVLIEHAVARLAEGHSPDQLLVITYGRDRAAFLRDQIAARASSISREPIARTVHAFAFGLLRRRALSQGSADPVLISGPEHDSILRDLIHGSVQEGLMAWPSSLAEAVSTRGFARELRDFLSRATERSLNPRELAQLAAARGRVDWEAIAQFYRAYLDQQALDGRNTVDPSALIVDAIAALADQEFLAETRAQFPLLLIDEFQESDPSQRLLYQLIGSELIIAVDPDSAVGRFRGAEPETALQVGEAMTDTRITLHRDHRAARAPFAVSHHVASGFRRSLPHRQRTSENGSAGAVSTVRLRSVTSEARYVAYLFRRAHLLEGVPWSSMAVVLRAPGVRVSAFQRAFAAEGIPVVVEGSALALANQPAVAPLVAMARIAIDPDLLTPERAEQLLLCPYGGADQLLLRRLRQEFRASDRPFGKMVVDALLGRDALADIDPLIAAPVRRIATAIAKAREAMRQPGVQAENVLWAMWESAVATNGRPLRDEWQDLALAGGLAGITADRDLDAVVALFETAARFADRRPGASVGSFFDEIDDQELPGDTIAARAQRNDVVEILTVHTAKGREWDIVAVPGVQEGEFPNLKLRGSLLGSDLLVSVMRNPALSDSEILQGAFSSLLDDERRLFYVALSRSRTETIVTAVDGEEDQPSRFFHEIDALDSVTSRRFNDLPRSLSLPSLIGELRRSNSPDAARVLRLLADNEVPGAAPKSWWGLAPLSTDEAIGSHSVSPSSVATYESCALRWFLEKHGGERDTSLAQGVGKAVHAVAEKMVAQELSGLELEALFDEQWLSINPPDGWVGERERTRAWSMITKLQAWQHELGRDVIATELRFAHEIEGVTVRGAIDRVERLQDGSHVLVDLKTGANAITQRAAEENAQLALYQLAVADGAVQKELGPDVDIAGAELVFLGTNTQSARTRSQPPIDLAATRERLVTVATGMSGASFIATPSSDCDRCAVRTTCPAMLEGRTVIS